MNSRYSHIVLWLGLFMIGLNIVSNWKVLSSAIFRSGTGGSVASSSGSGNPAPIGPYIPPVLPGINAMSQTKPVPPQARVTLA